MNTNYVEETANQDEEEEKLTEKDTLVIVKRAQNVTDKLLDRAIQIVVPQKCQCP